MTVINIAWEDAVRRDVTVEPYSQRADATWDAIGIIGRDTFLAGSGSFVDGESSPEPTRAALDAIANVVANHDGELFRINSNFHDDNYGHITQGQVSVLLKDHEGKRAVRWRGPIDEAPTSVRKLLAAASELDRASAVRAAPFDSETTGAASIERHHQASPPPLRLVQ